MGLRELNVDLTKDHVALWDATKKFVSEVWRPAAVALDKLADPQEVIAEDSVLWDVLRQSYALGYHCGHFPETAGGPELDPLSLALIGELEGWAAPDLAVSLGVCSTPYFFATMSPDPKLQELARKFTSDNEARYTGCWAITEPDHGCDWTLYQSEEGKNPAVAPQVRAVRDGDTYVINGQKSAWVSNGSFANHAALWMSVDPSKGMHGGGIAIIPLDLPGISRGKPWNKLGQRALNQGEIFFDNVRIPKEMVLAEDPISYTLFTDGQLALANGFMGITFAGCALAALEESLEYAKTRLQGGKPIIEHQNIKLKLFDMFASVEAARSLARRAMIYNSHLVKNMQPPATHYSMVAKIFSTEAAFRVASQAVQIFGGYGLSKEYLIEKIFRDARMAMIEDGVNEVLAIGATERIQKGRTKWVVMEGQAQTAGPAAAQGMTWEEFEPLVRPKPGTVHAGVMKADQEKCTQCGLCQMNCPFRAWEKDEEGYPRMKEPHDCFSCYNCLVACPVGAISIVKPYHVTEGYFKSDPGLLPAKVPAEPLDGNGNPDQWTVVERTIFERRSVRNFKPDPVPETLIKRVLEAGRFAPSSGNCQCWKFIVITDKKLINELNEACYEMLSMFYLAYTNDAMVKNLLPLYQQNPQPGLYDPRIILGGLGSIFRKEAPVFLDAPVVILLACDDRAIGGPQIQAGIAGQNMNLAANSLGLGSCWIGFSQILEMIPTAKEKLGLKDPWKINTAMVLGYPAFKQSGIVPREFRPVTWFREGVGRAEMEI